MNRFPKKIDGIGAKFIAVSLNKTKFLEWSYLNNNEMSTLIKKIYKTYKRYKLKI